jgi:hypothetical protein
MHSPLTQKLQFKGGEEIRLHVAVAEWNTFEGQRRRSAWSRLPERGKTLQKEQAMPKLFF